ncbi:MULTISPECIES: hypothetical protein [unclassified Pseudomonas]|uniref:hypothetical protein n=1 Tax=unclassified Pseudomonas TaxID=196821 RepID=UPI0015A493DA|nr:MULTISPECIES: hypothetical protein [unclassified Pseudomonas]NWB60016.1 hypothetical protein [Pseudomonas sp. F1002]NWC05738.1 hypothetical protein [Pseudomonas sp. G1002]
MSILEINRDVLPIWGSSKSAANSSELMVVNSKNSSIEFTDITPALLSEFRYNQTVGVAVELLNCSIIERYSDAALEAANFLVQYKNLPTSITQLILKTLGKHAQVAATSYVENKIQFLRQKIRQHQRDPITWVELSREYAIAGEKKKSTQAMLTAVQLSYDHRWITRSAARVFVHFDEPDTAHDILVRNPNIRTDPWLIATEMAVARKAGKKTKLWNIGKSLLDSKIKPVHLSELASSVATYELISGAEKRAKPFFKQSLIEPNQNSLAQAKWAERTSGLKKLVKVPLNSNLIAYEAQYWEAYNSGDMTLALSYALAWFDNEPYSNAPPEAVCFIAGLLEDYKLIAAVSSKALKANPKNTTLQINLMFSWLTCKNLKALNAKEAIVFENYKRNLLSTSLSTSKFEASHALANLGMINYRQGFIEQGKIYYEQSEEIMPHNKLYVTINHLRESLIAEAYWSEEILRKAYTLLSGPASSATPAAKFYLEKIAFLNKTNGTWEHKFSDKHLLDDFTKRLSIQATPPQKSIESTFWLPQEFSSIPSLSTFTERKK